MPILLNNCDNRDHVKHYGPGAFYDLDATGHHAQKATNLQPGAVCVVASLDENGGVVFDWYTFSHEARMVAEDGSSVRVFFGERIRSETLQKANAAASVDYAGFFNVNGHFKRQSVVEN